ncbi:serine/threonine protein kinase [Paenibacillus piri]|uniref:non-specific serine/threonine protein kinase n=1 Tax=Paenibacillus piri TaxID=2547395 RepID=A0A4R5KI92_9BACL|nr:protein kinase [Paenibacillus piri]TDF94478.1 serine/threonine-protein kinase [Paenibacillus piri]
MAIRYAGKHLWRRLNKKIREAFRLWGDFRRFREGSVINGRYTIVRKLGGGSYGVAYLCRDVRSGKSCVLKRISPLRGGAKRARLIYAKETGTLERLNHPALPALYSKFEYDGHLCFIMEYMEGTSLDALLFADNAVFTERDSLILIKKLLHVVDYMHAAGMLHRDISIGNVIVDGDAVKLIDLGLSRELAGGNAATDDPHDIEADDPSEKILRRNIHVTSDYYAVGHLLLFLLYSTFHADDSASAGVDSGWEQELTLHPDTKKLLRRLLLTEQPYKNVQEIIDDADRILSVLT